MYKINKINKESVRIEKVKRVVAITILVILIPIVVLNITLILKTIVNPNEMPNFLGFKNFVIVSKSMEPTIHVEDVIFVKEVPEFELREQDIVSFQDGNSITTHRIVNIEDNNGSRLYTTKGDNNTREDKQKITYNQIEGKYKFKLIKFGKITSLLKNKVVLFINIIILILLVVYQINNKKKKHLRREKRKNYKK